MALPVVNLIPPSDIVGKTNGKLPDNLLVTVAGSGRMHHIAARAWNAYVAEAKKAGIDLTYTGIYRTYAAQEALFRSRYTTTYLAGRPYKVWNGKRWYQKPGTAMAAVPGTSNHGWGLAVDVAIGRSPNGAVSLTPQVLNWMLGTADKFGFSWEVQSEAWHIRYIRGDKLPSAVLAYEGGTTPPPPTPEPPVVTPPTPPAPEPPPITNPPYVTEDDEMIILDYGYPGIDSWWTRMLWTGTHVAWVQGLSNQSLQDAGITRRAQITSDTHMMHILATSKAVTACPSTFVGNQGLLNAWNESRTRA